MIVETEKRWAIYQSEGDHKFLCGRFYFFGKGVREGDYDDPATRTFRTRKAAREAKRSLAYGRYKVVPVIVKVEMVNPLPLGVFPMVRRKRWGGNA